MKQPNLNKLHFDKKGTADIRRKMTNAKRVKITINFDADLINKTKRLADKSGIPYQRLINQLLRKSTEQVKETDSRLERLEKEVQRIKRKLVA